MQSKGVNQLKEGKRWPEWVAPDEAKKLDMLEKLALELKDQNVSQTSKFKTTIQNLQRDRVKTKDQAKAQAMEIQVISLLGNLRQAWLWYQGMMNKRTPPHARARAAQKVVDENMATAREQTPEDTIRIACKAGCAACCRYQVDITHDEATVLADKIISGHIVDEEKLKIMSEYGPRAYVTERQSCVFLGEDDRCTVYEDRPMSCRLHLVTSDPILCFKDSKDVASLINPGADSFASGVLTANRHDHLPKLVWEKLSERRKMQPLGQLSIKTKT